MKWNRVYVHELLEDVPNTSRVKNSDYLPVGRTPVVDQSREPISGYTDDPDARIEDLLPVVVFGDHTRILKFVDFPFARGADGTQVLRVDPQIIEPRFFFYALRTIDLSSYGYARHFKYLKNERVPTPSIAVQRRIANILSAYDDLIENNNRRMALLEESIHLLYREWFVYLRFPGHERVKVVDGVPEGWARRPMSEFVDTQYGFTTSAQDEPVGPKFVRGMDINKTPWIDWDTVPYCNVPDDLVDKYRVSIGDVLMIRMADPGKVGIIEQEVGAVFASYLVRLSIRDDSVLPYCFFYFLRSDEYQGFITNASTGATRKSASATLMTTPAMLIPSRPVQQQFEELASETRGLLNVLLKQNQKLREARDHLLPRLMDGRIPV